MQRRVFTILFLFSLQSFADFGMLGREQCQFPSTQYPTNQQDHQQSVLLQIQALEKNRNEYTQKMNQVNAEVLQLQGNLRYYFPAPWCDEMTRHMDNGLDCCAPSRSVSMVDKMISRLPASARKLAGGYEDTYGKETTENAAIEPAPLYVSPTTSPSTELPTVSTDTSCQGFPNKFCSDGWGTPPATTGSTGLCLQTGFAATPAWYQAACRNGGQIDLQACANPDIAKYPVEYKQCMQVLETYRYMSTQKRQLSAQIQAINNDITTLRSSNGQTYASGGSGGSGSGLRNFLSTIGPFMLSQYLSYRAQRSMSMQYSTYYQQNTPQQGSLGYASGGNTGPLGRGSLGGSTGVSYNSSAVRVPYYTTQQASPPNYGANFGFPFSYARNYGGLPPLFQTGGFGCGTGVLGAGMNIISLLAGAAQIKAQLQLGVNPNNSYPQFTYAGGTTSHQPGGIQGSLGSPQSHPIPFTHQTLASGNNGSGTPQYVNGTAGSTHRDAFFHSQILAAQERLNANATFMQNSNIDFNNQMAALLQLNAGVTMNSPQSVSAAPNLGTGQNNFNTFLQTLLMGGGIRANMNLNTFGGY